MDRYKYKPRIKLHMTFGKHDKDGNIDLKSWLISSAISITSKLSSAAFFKFIIFVYKITPQTTPVSLQKPQPRKTVAGKDLNMELSYSCFKQAHSLSTFPPKIHNLPHTNYTIHTASPGQLTRNISRLLHSVRLQAGVCGFWSQDLDLNIFGLLFPPSPPILKPPSLISSL